jgi:hypothetical protein
MAVTVEQDSLRPTNKVKAASVAAAGATVIVFTVEQFGVEVPGVVGAAVATLLAAAAGYFRRDKETSRAG